MNQEQTTEPKRTNGVPENVPPRDGAAAAPATSRVISDPNEVATIVLMQIDAVNDRKNDLTIALKGLTDITKQLMRSYGDHSMAIRSLQVRVKELEEKLAKTPG